MKIEMKIEMKIKIKRRGHGCLGRCCSVSNRHL